MLKSLGKDIVAQVLGYPSMVVSYWKLNNYILLVSSRLRLDRQPSTVDR